MVAAYAILISYSCLSFSNRLQYQKPGNHSVILKIGMYMKLLRIVLAILIPPVGVFLTYGLSTTLAINVLLTLLGWIPGIIHAIWAIAKYEEKATAADQVEAG
jgi:uncharacterized membrane protein YqaE (UPF0057 family)